MSNLKKMLLKKWYIYVFTAVIFIKVVSLNYAIKLESKYINVMLLLGCLGSALLLMSFCFFMSRRHSAVYFFVIDILVSLILLTDTVYNRYFSDVTSFALLKQAHLVGEVGDSVKNLLRPADFLYFADLPVLIPLWKHKNAKLSGAIDLDKPVKSGKRNGFSVKAVSFLFIFAAGFIMCFASAFALDMEQPGILHTIYDKKYVVKNIGDLNFHGVDIYRYVSRNVFGKNKISDDEKDDIKQWYDQKNKGSNAKYNNSMDGKNLIVVQLESFQGFVLNRSINGQEITPNLNKLSKESLVFDNYYCETAWGGTSDAEFLSNVSLLPSREGSVYYQYAGDTYESLVSELKKKGYYTSVMHANRPGFWNRTEMYKSMGFDKYENENDYSIDDVVGMGLSDESFFKQSVSKLESYKQPFYSFMISLSSHYPFTDENGKIPSTLDTGEFNGKFMGNYLNSVRYTDSAIGELIDLLKKDGLWDNSVVVFYGDHKAIPEENEGELAKLLYGTDSMTPLQWFNSQKVVSMIHFPESKVKKHLSITAGELDLYPTLANLFGCDAKYALGRDLLNSKEGFMMTRDRGWADNNAAYIQSIDKVVDIKTGAELNPDKYESQFAKAKEYLKVSDATIEHNLIHYFNEDEDEVASVKEWKNSLD